MSQTEEGGAESAELHIPTSVRSRTEPDDPQRRSAAGQPADTHDTFQPNLDVFISQSMKTSRFCESKGQEGSENGDGRTSDPAALFCSAPSQTPLYRGGQLKGICMSANRERDTEMKSVRSFLHCIWLIPENSFSSERRKEELQESKDIR